MNDEEVAFRIVRLYFEDIARLGFKRSLDLDQIINAYFYALKKLKGKDAAMRVLAEKLVNESKQKSVESDSPLTGTVPSQKVTTTTTTTVTNNKPKSNIVSEIIESK